MQRKLNKIKICLTVTEESKDMLDQLAYVHRRTKGAEFERILKLYHDKIEEQFAEQYRALQEQKNAID